MGLYSPPPPARPFSEDKPTLLISWWITAMCAVIILLRLVGRYIRVETLFFEDKIAAAALIPLFLRMALVHPVFLYGTNNVLVDDAHPLTETEIRQRSIGSRLVLVSRIVQPAILWLFRAATVAFFDRLVGLSGRNAYTLLLRATRVALAVTFAAVVVADLAECGGNLALAWQVVPDPGARCRQGYAQLVVAAVGSALIDVLLVALPVPIVARSRLSLGRKVLLGALFCLHLPAAAVAIYRVPQVVREAGYQPTRSMWASAEVLVAAFAANALTIGTFVRDTGVKKKRFRYQPAREEVEEEGRVVVMMRSGGKGGSQTAAGAAAGVKNVSWDDPASSDDGGEHDETVRGHTAKATVTGRETEYSRATQDIVKEATGLDGRSRVVARTESLDSLIPRTRHEASTTDEGKVLKTTTIEVSVSSASEPGRYVDGEALDGLVLRPAEGVVTASAKGQTRGSSILLRNLESLPKVNVG
ncbi:hypothetical protein C7999DRAFT_32335 [Corynascus novoguineensis]|uniref:Rhodopsin domain-containing protein n=1 Tax=Corynascus novoguineensis TaxID=1126955 RepID=A0AAN7CUR9_9PEZI|nr:hypothetical protein C7999DRAFT_32335 [Corynascus novoguineensis]